MNVAQFFTLKPEEIKFKIAAFFVINNIFTTWSVPGTIFKVDLIKLAIFSFLILSVVPNKLMFGEYLILVIICISTIPETAFYYVIYFAS